MGGCSIKPKGKVVMKQIGINSSRVLDVADITRTIEETSAVFVATLMSVTEGQKQQYCDIIPCESNKDCLKLPVNPPFTDHKCLPSGYCM